MPRPSLLYVVSGGMLILAAAVADAAQARPTAACARPTPRSRAVAEVVRLRESPPPCRLVIEPTGRRVFDPSGAVLLDPSAFVVVRDTRGRLITRSSSEPGELVVWSAEGTVLARFGRAGAGPGELAPGYMDLFVGPNHSVFVRDNNFRWTEFDSLYRFVRHHTVQSIDGQWRRSGFLPDGRFLTSVWRDRSGTTHFRVGRIGAASFHEFGPVRGDVSEVSDVLTRAIAISPDGSAWAAAGPGDPRGYLLEQWRPDGRLLQSIERRPSWFRARSTGADARETRHPAIAQLHLDSSGVLLVVSSVANASWRAMRSAADRRAVRSQGIDVVIDAIDTRSGSLLASETFRAAGRPLPLLGLFPGTSLAYRYAEDSASGEPYLEILRYRLVAR
jgi:hypothetical protein